MRVFHVTPQRNLPAIMQQGLVPQIGERAAKLAEPEPAVYLFPNQDEVEQALMTWLGNEFDEEESLVILVLEVDQERLKTTSAGFELVSVSTIDPACLCAVLDETLNPMHGILGQQSQQAPVLKF